MTNRTTMHTETRGGFFSSAAKLAEFDNDIARASAAELNNAYELHIGKSQVGITELAVKIAQYAGQNALAASRLFDRAQMDQVQSNSISPFDVSSTMVNSNVMYLSTAEMEALTQVEGFDTTGLADIVLPDDYTPETVVVKNTIVRTESVKKSDRVYRHAAVVAPMVDASGDKIRPIIGRQAVKLYKIGGTDELAKVSCEMVEDIVDPKISLSIPDVADRLCGINADQKLMMYNSVVETAPSIFCNQHSKVNVQLIKYKGEVHKTIGGWVEPKNYNFPLDKCYDYINQSITYIGPDRKGLGYVASSHMDGLPLNAMCRKKLDFVKDLYFPPDAQVIYLNSSDLELAKLVFINLPERIKIGENEYSREPIVIVYKNNTTYVQVSKKGQVCYEEGRNITEVKEDSILGMPMPPVTSLKTFYIDFWNTSVTTIKEAPGVKNFAQTRVAMERVMASRIKEAERYSYYLFRANYLSLIEDGKYKLSALCRRGIVLISNLGFEASKEMILGDLMKAVLHASTYYWTRHKMPSFGSYVSVREAKWNFNTLVREVDTAIIDTNSRIDYEDLLDYEEASAIGGVSKPVPIKIIQKEEAEDIVEINGEDSI